MLIQAQEEADRVVDVARDKAKALTEDHELISFAKERAKEIETEAKKQAEDIISESDEYIEAIYSAEDLSGKATCKAALQKEAGLKVDPKAPVFGMITRLLLGVRRMVLNICTSLTTPR